MRHHAESRLITMRRDPLAFQELIIPEAHSAAYFFKRQGWHILLLSILIAITYFFAFPALEDGTWLGLPDSSWYWLAISVTVLHQILVWLVWRAQLGWGTLTRLFGTSDLTLWGIVFMPLLFARPIAVYGLAMSDRDSLVLPDWLKITVGILLFLPALYTLFSVVHFFGIQRALGGDHFRLKYRKMPFVRKGAFRWSGNAMYVFAFLGFWSIVFLSGSLAALSLAFFQHTYIWVHYYCTEEPDMTLIYPSEEGYLNESSSNG
jgi:hypothetical protein